MRGQELTSSADIEWQSALSAAGNRKEIYGDAYSGGDLEIGNFTRVYPNDDGAPGTGQVLVHRDLLISGGSNVEIAGEVKVNGFVEDGAGRKVSTPAGSAGAATNYRSSGIISAYRSMNGMVVDGSSQPTREPPTTVRSTPRDA